MDSRLQEVLLDYGLEGYGLYWYCLELIVNKVREDNITFELEHDVRIIARNTGSTTQRVKEMMTRFVHLGLFDVDTMGSVPVFSCKKIGRRLDQSMTSNKGMRKIINNIKAIDDNSHDGVMIESCLSHDKVMKEEKRKEEKRESKTSRKAKPFVPPTLDDVKAYVKERKLDVDPVRFYDYFTEGEWHDAKGNKVKNWKQKVLTWNNNGNGKSGRKEEQYDAFSSGVIY